MNKHLAAALIMTLALSLASQARAQDEEREARRVALAQDCSAREGLSLCIKDRAKKKARKVKEAAATGFGRFTKLAGKFMGREDAAEVGSFRFRIDLTLK
jgi:cytochrome c556